MNETLWAAIGTGTLFGAASGFSPGPLLVLVISETLRHGIRAGVLVAITPLMTDLPVLSLSLLLHYQLTGFDLILGMISLAGAAFLLWLGWQSWNTAGMNYNETNIPPLSLRTRLMTNYLNPSMYLFWFMVGGPFVMKSATQNLWPAIGFLFCFYGSIVGAKILLSVLTGKSRAFLSGLWYRRIMQALGLCLCGFAVMLLLDSMSFFGIA